MLDDQDDFEKFLDKTIREVFDLPHGYASGYAAGVLSRVKDAYKAMKDKKSDEEVGKDK